MTFQKQHSLKRGFTLIELIMVIVILGILSAFALPKFADFSGDAESSSIEGARGAIRSASAIAHAACLADSDCNASAATETITLEGSTVDLVTGYPAQADLNDLADLDGYSVILAANHGGTYTMITIESPTTGDPCFTYTEGNPPAISAVLTYDEVGTAATTDDLCN